MRLVALVAAAVLLMGGVTPSEAAPPKAVLILSEGPVLPYAAVLREQFIATLRHDSAEPLNIFEELIDRGRFDSDEYRAQLVALYHAKYVGLMSPALVVTITEPALDFVLRYRSQLFPDAAVVFSAVDERSARRDMGKNITGVYSRYDLRPTMDIALGLHPGTREVVVVAGMSRLDRGYLAVARDELRGFESRLAIRYLTDKTLQEVLATVGELRDGALVVFLSMQSDRDGVARTGPEVLGELRRVARVPIYGVSANMVGNGIVGGVVFEMLSHGSDLAQRAKQILAGTRADDLAPITSLNIPTFDWRELQRFGIDQARLPTGATVLFKEMSPWQLYRPQIIGAALLIVLQAGLISTLLLQRARRRRVDTALVESQQRYSLASAAGAVGIWDWNFETNQLFVDARLKSILGFEESEISSRPEDWGSRVHPQDVPASAAAVQACMAGVSDSYEVEHRMLHKAGGIKWMLSRGSAIRAADGRLLRLVGTKVDITDRKHAEEANRENQAVLQASHRQIHDLAGRLIASQEVERTRIARDLHDDLSQHLAGLSIALSGLKRRLSAVPEAGDLSGDVSSLQLRAVGLADNIRRLSHDLHPSVLQHAGLIAALSSHCADVAHLHSIGVKFTVDGTFESTDAAAALCLYRVAQEALRNVATHSRARHAAVHLQRVGDQAELTIADDGGGFDIVAAGKNAHGLGLVSITERVRLAGGTVTIVTELNKGTRVRVQIPANGHVLASHLTLN